MKNNLFFQNDEDFAKNIKNHKDPKSVNGYTINKIGQVKNSGPHPLKTAVHEYNHVLSDNSGYDKNTGKFLYKKGIKVYTPNERFPANAQINEAITEFLTKRMMGDKYPKNPEIAYFENMLRIESMALAFGEETLIEAYYNNKPELLINKYESVMGKGTWIMLSKAFDDAVNSSSYNLDKLVLDFCGKVKGV